MRSVLLFCLTLAALITHAATPSSLDYTDISKHDFFPILTWDPLHGWTKPFAEQPKHGLEAIAECNFNMGGFVYPADLKKCEELGLGGIVLPAENDFTNWDYFHTWWKMSDAEIDARIKRVVDAAGASPAFSGIFIVDEPHVREFPGLAKAVAAVKRYAPGKFAYINLHPNAAVLTPRDRALMGTDNYTDYLERFVNEVHPQALSYDNYMVQYSNDLKDPEKAALYYHNLLEVRRVAQKYHLPFLNIVASKQIKPHLPIPSPESLLFQAYTTVAAGYRGVTWYSFYSRGYNYGPIDNNGNRTLTFGYLKEVNRQIATLAPLLSKLESTGVYFSDLKPVADLPALPGKLVESVKSSAGTPVMVGEFGGSFAPQERYAMVVNLSLESTTQVHLTTVDKRPVKIVSAVDRSLSNYDPKIGLWLNRGQGVLLKW